MALTCGHDDKRCAACGATMETCAKCGAVDTSKRAVKRVAIVSTALAALLLRNAINESLPTCHMHVDVRETAAGVELWADGASAETLDKAESFATAWKAAPRDAHPGDV